jgi:hypothetical protein
MSVVTPLQLLLKGFHNRRAARFNRSDVSVEGAAVLVQDLWLDSVIW